MEDKIIYVAMRLHSTMSVNGTPVDVVGDGRAGYLPAFNTREAAEKFIESGAPCEIMEVKFG